MKLGNRFKLLREKRSKTVAQIAEETRISNSYLHDMEKNKVLPSLEMCQRMAMYYHISLAVLFFGVEISLSDLPPRKEAHKKRYEIRRIFAPRTNEDETVTA